MTWLLKSSRRSAPRALPCVFSGMFCLVRIDCPHPPRCIHSPSCVVTGWGDTGCAQGGCSSFSFFPSRYFWTTMGKHLSCCCDLLTSTSAHHIYYAVCTKLCEETAQSIFKIQPFISGSTRKHLQIGFGNLISLCIGEFLEAWTFL